jgi:hypothetical protein
MPKEGANNGWGIYAIRKFIEYAGIALAVWKLGIPAADAWYVDQREAYDAKYKKVPFRKLTSEEMDVPSDRVHIIIGEWYKDHVKHEKVINGIYPLLEQEIDNIRPRLEILPSGRAKWHHSDGEVYDASLGQDGFYWFYRNGIWYACHT